jgi:hypothetical protein
MPAADGGAEPEATDASSEIELQPFGLVARLRARKKLFLIAGGVLVLGMAGAVLASFLGDRARTEKPAEQASAKETAAPPKEPAPVAHAGAPAPEHPYHAEEAEQIEEGDEAVAKGAPAPVAAAKPVAEGSEQAQAEPQPKTPGVLSARDAAPSGARPGPSPQPASKADEAAPARTEVAAREPGATAQQPTAAAVHADTNAVPGEQAQQPTAAHADGHEQAAQLTAAVHSDAPGPVAEPALAPPGDTSPTAAVHADAPEPGAQPTAAHEPAAAPTPGEVPGAEGEAKRPGEPPSAPADAKPGEPPTPTAAAEPAPSPPPKKKPLTPQQLGSERHINPDQAEIRQMLALALKSSPRVAAADPWKVGEEAAIPDLLRALREAIAHGERGSPNNLKALRRYNATNHDDVFGHLLLAGFYANRGYSLDALDQYDLAYRIDSSSRGAPEMLNHALNMVAQGIAQSEAERFIERVYGREAQATITQQLRASGTTAAAAARLRQLQSHLADKRR